MQLLTAQGGVVEVAWWQTWKYMGIGMIVSFFKYGWPGASGLLTHQIIVYGKSQVDWTEIGWVFVISGATAAGLYAKSHLNKMKVPDGWRLAEGWEVADAKGPGALLKGPINTLQQAVETVMPQASLDNAEVVASITTTAPKITPEDKPPTQ